MRKRKPTPKQLVNLKKGREIQFQNELRRRRINPNPKPRIIEKIVERPVTVYNKPKSSNNVNLSLFDQFLSVKLFPIEINKKRENLNLNRIIRRLSFFIDQNRNNIAFNRQKTKEIIDYINLNEKKLAEKFKALENRISQLEKENNDLKEQMKELQNDSEN